MWASAKPTAELLLAIGGCTTGNRVMSNISESGLSVKPNMLLIIVQWGVCEGHWCMNQKSLGLEEAKPTKTDPRISLTWPSQQVFLKISICALLSFSLPILTAGHRGTPCRRFPPATVVRLD